LDGTIIVQDVLKYVAADNSVKAGLREINVGNIDPDGTATARRIDVACCVAASEVSFQ